MTAKSKRTSPLDRDGGGDPGGSLPGNQTAPMATDAEAEQAKLEAIERETDDANAAARLAAGWTRDDGRLAGKLTEIGAHFSDLSTEAVVESWTDQEAFNVEAFADAMLAPGRHRNEAGDEVTAEGVAIQLPDVLAAWEIHFETDEANEETDDAEDPHADCVHCGDSHPIGVLDHDLCPACVDEAPILNQLDRATDQTAGDTFDAEQVAAATTAGEGAVIAEEGETVADPATATAPLDDGLVNIPTDTAPVAVRLHELRILVTARRLYKSREGYSSNYGPPYIDQATVDAWIAAGLAEDVPSAGNMGGVRVTPEGRSALNRAPADQAA